MTSAPPHASPSAGSLPIGAAAQVPTATTCPEMSSDHLLLHTSPILPEAQSGSSPSPACGQSSSRRALWKPALRRLYLFGTQAGAGAGGRKGCPGLFLSRLPETAGFIVRSREQSAQLLREGGLFPGPAGRSGARPRGPRQGCVLSSPGRAHWPHTLVSGRSSGNGGAGVKSRGQASTVPAHGRS